MIALILHVIQVTMTDLRTTVAAGILSDPQTVHPSVQHVLRRHQYEQRTPAWYDVRKGLITASDAGGALNIPAFKSQSNPRRDCLRQKTTGSFTGNHMTRHGQKYEDEVRERAMQALGECAWEVGLLVHEKYAWLGASPDGISSTLILCMHLCLRSSLSSVPSFLVQQTPVV